MDLVSKALRSDVNFQFIAGREPQFGVLVKQMFSQGTRPSGRAIAYHIFPFATAASDFLPECSKFISTSEYQYGVNSLAKYAGPHACGLLKERLDVFGLGCPGADMLCRNLTEPRTVPPCARGAA